MISKSTVKFTGDVAFISVTSYPGIFKKNQNSGPVQEFLVSETITFFCVKSQFTLEEQFLIFICYLEVFHFGVEQTLINSRSHDFRNTADFVDSKLLLSHDLLQVACCH